MRQARRTGRTPSTRTTGRVAGDRPSDPRAALVQGWDELLRLVPADMGLTAALGQGSGGASSDPIAWISAAADIPRKRLDEVRHIRNNLAANRLVPDRVISSAQETLDQALAVLGRMRLPE